MIFSTTMSDGYEWLECALRDVQTIFNFTGASIAADWKPISVKLITRARGKALSRSDFPSLVPYRLAMRRSAAEALANFWEGAGELLPLRAEDGSEFVILNVTRVLDALDEKRSDLLRFDDGGEIMSIRTPVFVESVVGESDVFRLPYRGSPTYLSHRFMAAVDALGLKGLDFTSGITSLERVH